MRHIGAIHNAVTQKGPGEVATSSGQPSTGLWE